MSKICITIFTFHTMEMLRNSKMAARMAIDANGNVPSAMVSIECWFGEPGVALLLKLPMSKYVLVHTLDTLWWLLKCGHRQGLCFPLSQDSWLTNITFSQINHHLAYVVLQSAKTQTIVECLNLHACNYGFNEPKIVLFLWVQTYYPFPMVLGTTFTLSKCRFLGQENREQLKCSLD